jgi:WXG100 family type VII secretion target
MAGEITADYEALEKEVRGTLARLVDDVEQMDKHIGGKTDTLRDKGWQGEGSDSFYAEMNDEITPAVRRLRKALERAGNVVGEVAKTFREAEEQARSGLNTATQ